MKQFLFDVEIYRILFANKRIYYSIATSLEKTRGVELSKTKRSLAKILENNDGA